MHKDARFQYLFRPETVAVVGASRKPGKVGHEILRNIVEAGYKGKIFPVNPAGGEILGLPVVTDVERLPDFVDLAVICVPREETVEVVTRLAERGVRSAVVITAGFKESGKDGYLLEQRLKAAAERGNLALLGPNCMGFLNAAIGLNASLAAEMPPPGSIAFFSQSGALCAALLDWALGEDIGFSKFCSLGNKTVVDESDIMEALGRDEDTKVIVGYVESVEDGQRLVRTAQAATAEKPVIMLKAGTTAAGARAVSSHTGAMAGSARAYTAAFGQGGIIAAEDVESLFGLARAFASQPLPEGPNVAVVTNSGGPGILAADACENSDLTLARPSPETLEKLREILPPFSALYNPIDILGDAGADRYRASLEAVMADPQYHAVLVLLSPTASAEVEATAKAMIEVAEGADKPVFACFMGEERIGPGRDMLLEAGIPCYGFPEPAIQALEAMHRYKQWKTRPYPVEICFRRDEPKASRLIAAARNAGLTELVDLQAMELASAYEMPTPETVMVRTSDQAVKAAKRMGYPVVLKLASPHIEHKSALGAVALNLGSPAEVRRAFLDITSRAMRLRPDAYISGCLVQQMAPEGSREVVVRFQRDKNFGPLILFGLAGVHTDVLEDWSCRLAPLTVGDAHDMIREVRSFPLLRGVRGEEPVDFKAIEDILLTVSQMAVDFPAVQEAEFNPILVHREGATVADMRMTVV